jgi:hypothetical protein
MEATTSNPAPSESVAFGRLWWVGLLAIAVAAAANALVRAGAVALFDVPARFEPLMLEEIVLSTVIGVAGATGVYAIVGWLAKRPIRIFRILAGVALLLSFVPPLSLPGVSIPIILTLGLMHIVAAAISVGLLTTLARGK